MEGEGGSETLECQVCSGAVIADGSDGFFYCVQCGSQAEDIIDTAVADEDLYDLYNQRKAPVEGPSEESNALSFEDYFNKVRERYVSGLQLMLQFQCEALVKDLGANPLVSQMCGPIWLRFVASTRVFDDGWAVQAILDSETQRQGDAEDKKPIYFTAEPRNLHGQRAVMLWFYSLRKRIPLSSSLAISFLSCHVAREAILPTDIAQWSNEGRLPYFSAFKEVEKIIGKHSRACPLTPIIMFRPSESVHSQKLESQAASIAQTIGLDLPPVNFHQIASRYLNMLSLPEERILQQARLIQEWSMPPDLWLSSSEKRLPTRVCIMSILIVAIRILYNINGFGVWEKNLSEDASSSAQDGITENSNDFDAKKLLQKLHARYDDIGQIYEYSKDLPTYLQYCKDVVFADLKPSNDNIEEPDIIKMLWEFYQKNKAEHRDPQFPKGSNQKRPRESSDKCTRDSLEKNKKLHDEGPSDTDDQSYESSSMEEDKDLEFGNRTSAGTNYRDRAIRRLKTDMEDNQFEYIPPRVVIRRFDYLHYQRKNDSGALVYVGHADYYILLRACARAAQVDVRLMHMGVLMFEKRLAWLEKRIDHCLSVKPPVFSCEFCCED